MILGIDTSSTDLSVSLCVDGVPLSSVDRYVKNAHAEHIAQAVAAALGLGGADVGDVTHVAVSAGPGSFTGLRIGLSFVKGFCMAVERTVLPLSSLLVLAHAAAAVGCAGSQSRRIFTAIDARQGRLHWGGFIYNGDNNNGGKNNIRRLSEDRLSSSEELLRELSQNDILITDTMGYRRGAVFGEFCGAAQIVDAQKSFLRRGLSCASIAFDTIVNNANRVNAAVNTVNDSVNSGLGNDYDNDEFHWRPASQIVPNYLQASAAEEKRAS
ncbi:MAG: tRNA (adenosine(37)-N6)-threonylcarbamoyltransferase complex dimerization subunit type 1 TsaB [Chitinispirillales bacterium]|nr:tRNA (adenosine(37)-N6)-threonylcarbamoyltransferase complex dimerization subunit type 1 TsaB [Chitinispirillales bacterium]